MTPGSIPAGGKVRLLEAAVDLVAEGGYAGATVSEVCRRAGVGPPALYYHYGNKDGLVSAVVEAVAGAWLDELEAAVGPSSDFADRLAAGLVGWRALIVAPHAPIRLLVRVQLECKESATAIGNALQQVMRRSRTIIARAIEGAVGPVRDADELAQTAVSLVQGAALRYHLDGDDAELDRRLGEIGWTLAALVERRSAEQRGGKETGRKNR